MLAKATARTGARAAAPAKVAAPAPSKQLLASTAGALLLSIAVSTPAYARLPPELYKSSNNTQANASKNVEAYREALASRGAAAPQLNSSGEV